MTHPFRSLVGGRLLTYFDEAFIEHERGRLRGAYDYAMLALNSTLFELKAEGPTLFAKLDGLANDGRIDQQLAVTCRAREFLSKHDRGITDMDLTYMTNEDLNEFLSFLEGLYLSLAAHGVKLANDPRGQ